MHGMLQHTESYRQEVQRHQQEAHEWARVGVLGRLGGAFREQSRQHPVRTRVMAVASPMAVAFGVLLILI